MIPANFNTLWKHGFVFVLCFLWLHLSSEVGMALLPPHGHPIPCHCTGGWSGFSAVPSNAPASLNTEYDMGEHRHFTRDQSGTSSRPSNPLPLSEQTPSQVGAKMLVFVLVTLIFKFVTQRVLQSSCLAMDLLNYLFTFVTCGHVRQAPSVRSGPYRRSLPHISWNNSHKETINIDFWTWFVVKPVQDAFCKAYISPCLHPRCKPQHFNAYSGVAKER